mmetsp:Transcript_6651/g.16314  ORF Transcript_6651/g.16314 Transcript_6651/m.16314 type:complete len:357 (-) Transcript_6651:154-1224(-)
MENSFASQIIDEKKGLFLQPRVLQRVRRGRAPVTGIERKKLRAQVPCLRKIRPRRAFEVNLEGLQPFVNLFHLSAAHLIVPRDVIAEHVLREGHVSSHEDVENDPHGPEIARWRVVATKTLRRDVAGRPDDSLRLRGLRRPVLARVEINQLQIPRPLRLLLLVCREQNVFRFDVAVDEPLRVQVVHGTQYLAHYSLAFPLWHVRFIQQKVEQLPATAFLHHNVVALFVLQYRVDAENVVAFLDVHYSCENVAPHPLAARKKTLLPHLHDHIFACRSLLRRKHLAAITCVVEFHVELVEVFQFLWRGERYDVDFVLGLRGFLLRCGSCHRSKRRAEPGARALVGLRHLLGGFFVHLL